MNTRHTRHSGRAGFTLIEVLLTLLIMSGIMIAMTSILTAARTSRDTIHNIQEMQLAGPAILDRIEGDLRALTTLNRTRQMQFRIKNRVQLGFDADGLDFVSNTRSLSLHEDEDRFVRAPLNELGYCLRVAPGTDQFLELYRREGFGVDAEPFVGGTYLLLHERVRGFDIRCWEKDGPDEESLEEWGDDKDDEHIGLPARIEISLTIELAPRLVGETLRIAPTDKRTIVYKRVIRFPEGLRASEEDLVVPRVPKAPAATGGAGSGSGGTSTETFNPLTNPGQGRGQRGGDPFPTSPGAGAGGGGGGTVQSSGSGGG